MGLAEIAVRLLGAAPEVALIHAGRFRLSDDREIGYEPAPNFDYRGDDLGDYDYRGRSNSLGFRDVDHPLAKPPGTYRIIVLGDSIAAGLGIADREQVFPALLEHRLRDSGLRAEVLNFGVSGYDTRQEVATLRVKGLAFRPDLVVVAYCLNDMLDDNPILDDLLAQARKRSRVGVARLNPYLIKSALYRFLRYRLASAWTGARPGAAPGGTPRNPVPARPALENPMEDSFRALAEMARPQGFAVLVAIFPRFDDLDHYARSGMHRMVRQAADAAGLRTLDLLDAFRKCAAASGRPVAQDALHPSVAGHACAAEALTDAISRFAGPSSVRER